MTKAHELRIFFDCARKTIVFVRLTTVRLSVCNSSSQLTYTRGYCIIHNTEGPQIELRSQTDLPTNQPHQIQYWQNQQNNPRQNQQQNHESIQVQPAEQHGICDRVFKAIKTKNTTVLFALLSKNSIPPLAKASWTEYSTLLQPTTSPTTKNHHSIM